MASVRKRTWTAAGETKTAWFVDYYDSRGQRQRKHFANKKAVMHFASASKASLPLASIGLMQASSQLKQRAKASSITVKVACVVMSE